MRDVVALGVALAAALTWAYVVWTDETPETEAEGVDLYQAAVGDVSRITYTSDTLTVVAERRTDANGPYVWVDSTEKKVKKKKPKDGAHGDPSDGHDHEEGGEEEPAAPEPGPDGAPAPEEPEEVEIKHAAFMAGTAGDDLWKGFAPLQAMRELPEPKDKATYGLDAPKATLEITRGSGPLAVALGGETFGAKDRYVEVGGKVYLLDDAKTKPLEHATNQLVEHALYPQAEATIEKITVAAPAGTATFVQKNKEDPKAASWVNAATDTGDESAKAWIKKFLSVKLREYVLAGEEPAGLTPVAKFAVTGDGKTWNVDILRDNSEPAKWYARSEYDRALVTLTEMPVREVVDDLPTVMPAAPE